MSGQILLVEPDALLRDLISLAVRRIGLECRTVRSTAEARLALAGEAPALLLVDLHLDGENGLELVEAVKKSRRYAALPVIVLSAFTYPEVILQAQQAGVSDFLAKPLDIDLLLERIERAVNQE